MSANDGNACPTAEELETYVGCSSTPPAVLDHLERCNACRDLMNDIVANNALAERLRSSQAVAPLGSAGAIEGYDILDEIQRGGQGVVYRARQRATNRIVALKLLIAGAFATSQQRRRFEREVELLAGLEHPHIVTIYDSGETSDGGLYLAMQYIEGVTLDEWLKERRRLPASRPAVATTRLLELFCGICDGVAAAHRHGVIHRDLKPANVIIDAEDQPHILDFGLARPIGPDAPDAHDVTVAGAFLGTLAYAAPEQTRRAPALVDVRSDVYALGVMLYEALAGQRPLEMDGDLSAILAAIEGTVPSPPSARDHGVTPTPYRIDDELDTIVMTCLAKEPERRYQSVSAVREDVQRYQAGAPIVAKGDHAWYVLRKALVRYRVPVGIGVAFALLLIAFTVVTFLQSQRIGLENDKLREINVFLEDTLGSVRPSKPGGDVVVRELLDEASQWIDIALADQPEVAASIGMTVANSYRALGRLDDAERLLGAAMQRQAEVFRNDDVELARFLNAYALLRRDQGRFDEAGEMFERAIEMRRARLGNESIQVAYALANLANVRRRQDRLIDAEDRLNESLAIRRHLFGNEHQDVAMCLFTLALVAEDRGEIDAAERTHREALRIRRRVLSAQHPDRARSLEALARLLVKRGQPNEAVELLEECLEARRRFLAADHWEIWTTQTALGMAHVEAGAFASAEPLLLEAERALSDVFGPTDARVCGARRALVVVYSRLERPDRARAFEECE